MLQPRFIDVPCGKVKLEADYACPDRARGLVIFAHASGTSRFNRQNQQLSRMLNETLIATLSVDLLTTGEATTDGRTAELQHDLTMLASRLTTIVEWTTSVAKLGFSTVGLLAASSTAAAAIITASRKPDAVAAVVARGGRPDRARDALRILDAATLFIVGEADPIVLGLNRDALTLMRCPRELLIVEGASHMFPEEGAMETLSEATCGWFRRYLWPHAVAQGA